jgi:hypothetical protein
MVNKAGFSFSLMMPAAALVNAYENGKIRESFNLRHY